MSLRYPLVISGQNKNEEQNVFLVGRKRNEWDPDQDPHENVTDPEHCTRAYPDPEAMVHGTNPPPPPKKKISTM
jgi:hypothetical protein